MERIPYGIYSKELREEAVKLITEGGYAVMREMRPTYSIHGMCPFFKVSASGFYKPSVPI